MVLPPAVINMTLRLDAAVSSATDAVLSHALGMASRYTGVNTTTLSRGMLRSGTKGVVVAVGASALSWLACLLRLPLPKAYYHAHFGASFIAAWVTAGAWVLPAVMLERMGILGTETVHRFAATVCSLAVKAVNVLNPQLRFYVRATEDIKKQLAIRLNEDDTTTCNDLLAAAGSLSSVADLQATGGVFAVNHTSFFDGFALATAFPALTFHRCRCMGKASIRDIPIFGYLAFDVLGYFKVYYKSDKTNYDSDEGQKAYDDWSLDRDKQGAEMARVQHFLTDHRGIFFYSPEGRCGKVPEEIQPARFGMLKILAETKKPVYLLTVWGAHHYWPVGCQLGGCPARVTGSVSKYEWPDPLPRDAQGQLDGSVLSEDIRKFMQAQLDLVRFVH